jgi:uncharacterized protein
MHFLRASFLCLPWVVLACSPRSGTSSGQAPPTVQNQQFLESAAVCMQNRTVSFRASTEQLATAPEANRQTAFAAVQKEWQTLEAFAFGPLGMSSVPGGKELRAGIYSWPRDSRCSVSQTIVDKSYEKADFGTASISQKRGLAALEVLLFSPLADSGCAADNPVTAEFNALSPAERSTRAKAYAAVLTQNLKARAAELENEWSKTGANFADELAKAGRGSKVYLNERAALNTMADAILRLSLDVKNMKMGTALGIQACVATDPDCLNRRESQYANLARDHIVDNLRGMQLLLEGCSADGSGKGFDDLLIALGPDGADFAKRLIADLRSAIDKTSKLPSGSIVESGRTNPSEARAAYDAVKVLEVDLKTEFVSLLNLELPREVATDND